MIEDFKDTNLSIDECPLVIELKKLKKSSSEAIDNEEKFSDFKKYMHIHRSIEDDLIEKIEQAKRNTGKALILVCGNVGDGKSHIISYLRHNHGELLDGFIIHNDATESRSRNRDEKDELARVLYNFSDININNDTNDKIIVAINLGVLSNFIDTEKGKGKEFTKFAEYVNKNNILIDTIVGECSDNAGCFYHINFGDYHIYRLNNATVDSPYISEIIDKIFNFDEKNPFYQKYKKCNRCIVNGCPVKSNFEMLQNKNITDGLIKIIIETIVKDKVILSTRELLDFFYDIVVHPDFDKSKYTKRKNSLDKFIKYSMPSLMYEHNEVSTFLTHVKEYDFINQRTELFDEIITRFNTTDNIADVFKKYVSDNPIIRHILSYDLKEICINNSSENKELKQLLFNLFARLFKLAPKQDNFPIVNDEYNDFIIDLFYSIKADKKKLQKLYRTVERCIYEWNGGSYRSKRINLKGNIEGYVVLAGLDLDPDLSIFSQTLSENTFEKFPSYINLTITKKKETGKSAKLSIDYDLYKMLKLVENGYRPSAKDNNRYIGFLSFVNRLVEFSSYEEEVTIQCFLREENKEYNLSKGGFGYSFSEVK